MSGIISSTNVHTSNIKSATGNSAITIADDGTVSGVSPIEIISTNSGQTAQSFIDVTLPTNSYYYMFHLVMLGVIQSATEDNYMTFMQSGSAVTDNGYYSWQRIEQNASSNVSNLGGGSNSDSKIRYNVYAIGNAEAEESTLDIKIYGSTDNSLYTTMMMHRIGEQHDGDQSISFAGGRLIQKQVNDGVRLSNGGSSTLTHKAYTLWGYRKTL